VLRNLLHDHNRELMKGQKAEELARRALNRKAEVRSEIRGDKELQAEIDALQVKLDALRKEQRSRRDGVR
jgi:hypothetical protein